MTKNRNSVLDPYLFLADLEPDTSGQIRIRILTDNFCRRHISGKLFLFFLSDRIILIIFLWIPETSNNCIAKVKVEEKFVRGQGL